MKSVPVLLILVVVIGIAVFAGLSATQPRNPEVPASPNMTTVRVAYIPLISSGPIFIAQEEGYFARQGINVEFEKFPSVSSSLFPLVNGDIAVSGGAITPSLIAAVTKGSHVRIVADKGRNSPLNTCNASGLMVRRDLYESGTVTRAADLNGMKVMTPDDKDYSFSRILARGNLTPDDIEIVTMDFPSALVALRNGAIDAAVLTEPYVTQASDGNVAVMLLPNEICTPDFPTPLYYGPAFLDRNPELGRRFMVAYLEGVRQYNLGKTERNLAILANYTHLDRDLLKRTCWMPIAPDGDLPRQPVRDYLDWMSANNMITQKPEDDQIFDMSYVGYANGVLRNTTDNR